MTQSTPPLRQVLVKIRELGQNGGSCLVVFDLDSTLFDVSPRLERILIDFAALPESRQRFPEQVEKFKHIKTLRSDWGIQGALMRAGLDGHHPEFQQAVKAYWQANFFSSHYLQYDLPYDGAIDYVKAVHKEGARIAYLTGRDRERMGRGSVEVLKQWGFPLIEGEAELVLKPHKSMDDAEFKTGWFEAKHREGFTKIYFFENEPVNIHHLRGRLPEVDVLFMNTTHAGKAAAPVDVPHIMNFLCDWED